MLKDGCCSPPSIPIVSHHRQQQPLLPFPAAPSLSFQSQTLQNPSQFAAGAFGNNAMGTLLENGNNNNIYRNCVPNSIKSDQQNGLQPQQPHQHNTVIYHHQQMNNAHVAAAHVAHAITQQLASVYSGGTATVANPAWTAAYEQQQLPYGVDPFKTVNGNATTNESSSNSCSSSSTSILQQTQLQQPHPLYCAANGVGAAPYCANNPPFFAPMMISPDLTGQQQPLDSVSAAMMMPASLRDFAFLPSAAAGFIPPSSASSLLFPHHLCTSSTSSSNSSYHPSNPPSHPFHIPPAALPPANPSSSSSTSSSSASDLENGEQKPNIERNAEVKRKSGMIGTSGAMAGRISGGAGSGTFPGLCAQPKHPVGPGTNNVRVRTKDTYRVVYNECQRLELEREFATEKFISVDRKAALATRLQLTERQIKIWFQNRRAKERRQKKHISSSTAMMMMNF